MTGEDEDAEATPKQSDYQTTIEHEEETDLSLDASGSVILGLWRVQEEFRFFGKQAREWQRRLDQTKNIYEVIEAMYFAQLYYDRFVECAEELEGMPD